MFTQAGPYLGGFSGRISRISPDGTRETVADRLPSTRDGLGPSDVAWIGRTMYAVIEGGGCSRGLPDHPAGIVRIERDGGYRYVADISAFTRANPVASEPVCGPQGDCEPDGVPHSLLAVGDKLYVVETNHNRILRVDPRSGAITRLFDLETFAAETPWTPNTGRVVRRGWDGSRTLIASGLNFPIGMTRGDGWRHGEALYVTTSSHGQGPVEGRGQIVRIRVKHGHGTP